MKLSERLQYIADEIMKGETMADIGTDHGFLPLYLLEKSKCPKVIMADISSGSLKKAETNCKLVKPRGDYELRLGNGIDVLKDGEVDVVVIAGMGGLLIADILEWNLYKSRSVKRYILQPRNNPGRLRHWLCLNGFTIVKEGIVREGKFLCEIFTVESGCRPVWTEENPAPLYSAAFDYPESLISCESPLITEYLNRHLEIEEQILERIIENGKNVEIQGAAATERICQLKMLKEKLKEKLTQG